MKISSRQGSRNFAAGFALIAAIATGTARASEPATPESIIRTWPASERAAAGTMIEKYGKPAQFDRHALVWFNNGNWKRTVVYRRGPHDSAKSPDKDFLQQTIGYIVPNDKIDALKKFNNRLEVSATAGELTFASRSEATNLLALNLADEIVVGKRSVSQARSFFAKTLRLAASGKSSPYREGLKFDVDNARYMTPTSSD